MGGIYLFLNIREFMFVYYIFNIILRWKSYQII